MCDDVNVESKRTATMSTICRAPPAALFSGGNASAAAYVSLSNAKAASPPSLKIGLPLIDAQGYGAGSSNYSRIKIARCCVGTGNSLPL